MRQSVVRGGVVVTPSGEGRMDILVRDGVIAALGVPDQFDAVDAAHIDAAGCVVAPGGIDPHIHADWPVSRTEPDLRSAGPDTVSRAAALGGTTTLLDFVVCEPGDAYEAHAARMVEHWQASCHVDFGFHLMLSGDHAEDDLAQLPALLTAGFQSVKVFTTNVRPRRRGRMMGFGPLWDVMNVCADHGAVVALHAEDDDLVMHQYARHERRGLTHFQHMPQVHSDVSEDVAFRRAITLSAHAGRPAVYFMHVSAATGVRAIADARRDGLPVVGETLPQYGLKTADAYLEPGGQVFHTYPSLKDAGDAEALLDGLATGTLQVMATDSICTPLEIKVHGDRIDDVTGGNVGVETRLALTYTELVGRRGCGLSRFVDVTSANAARIFGMYPRKGAIVPGSDADLVALDPALARTLSAASLVESDYTPWEGVAVDVWPRFTMLRGEVIAQDGRWSGGSATGQHVVRRLDGLADLPIPGT